MQYQVSTSFWCAGYAWAGEVHTRTLYAVCVGQICVIWMNEYEIIMYVRMYMYLYEIIAKLQA